MFPSVRIFDSLPSGGRDGFDLTIYSHFLDLYRSYVEFTFCVCRKIFRLIEMEICVDSLFGSLLDR